MYIFLNTNTRSGNSFDFFLSRNNIYFNVEQDLFLHEVF